LVGGLYGGSGGELVLKGEWVDLPSSAFVVDEAEEFCGAEGSREGDGSGNKEEAEENSDGGGGGRGRRTGARAWHAGR